MKTLISHKAPPFSKAERMIAWRYIRAKKAEGGVSVMTWISLLGVTLAVFALIATLAVRAGFRQEFVGTILGANPHITVYPVTQHEGFTDYEALSARLAGVSGVNRAAPAIRGQVMVSAQGRTSGAEVFGISAKDFVSIPSIGHETNGRALGDIGRYDQGIAMGLVMAQDLGVRVGDRVRLISADGVQTPFGLTPRVISYEVVYIFSAGRYDIDKTRIYMPLEAAQSYFNREGRVDEIDIMLQEPEQLDRYSAAISAAAEPDAVALWTWRDSAGAFLRALTVEDNIMFVIMSILVLIASMNITSGLVMLVRNKGRDIGILRTMGFDEGAILRIFFMCGAVIGLIGTFLGVGLGCLFALYIDPIFSAVNMLSGGGVWDPSIRAIYHLPAKLQWHDVMSAVALSLGLSFSVTFIPARRASRLNPVEALRYE